MRFVFTILGIMVVSYAALASSKSCEVSGPATLTISTSNTVGEVIVQLRGKYSDFSIDIESDKSIGIDSVKVTRAFVQKSSVDALIADKKTLNTLVGALDMDGELFKSNQDVEKYLAAMVCK